MEEAINYRFSYMLKMKVKDAPVLFKYGAICRRDDDDSLEDLFKSSRASFSYGYLGIDDCVRLLLDNKTILDKEGKQFGLEIIEFLKNEVDRIKKETGIPLSLYGTPAESCIHSFFQADLKNFKAVMPKWLLDREYYTNSFHFSSELDTDGFSKIEAECDFISYSNGGNIMYTEMGGVRHNIQALLELLQYGYKHKVQYQAFNVRASTCYDCGFIGEIPYNEQYNNYECPNCKNRNNKNMSIILRCCGLNK